jgi:glycine/D-amino acid oxidase-like deaminating enzyme
MINPRNAIKDYLIVGQGLAGSLLAWQLLGEECSVTILDHNHHQSASMVAAGIINPFTGKRFLYTENFHEYLPVAIKTYRELEKIFQQQFYFPLSTQRVFNTPEEKELWQRQKDKNALSDDAAFFQPSPKINPLLHAPHGSAIFTEGGYCDTHSLLLSLRELFKKKNVLINAELNYNDIKILADGIMWQDQQFRRVIFCEGFQVKNNPWFKDFPFSPSKGEILTLQSSEKLPRVIFNNGKWLLPVEDKNCKAGATFQWKNVDCLPTEEGKSEIMQELQLFLKPNLTVTDHRAGVRVSGKDLAPLIGMHPKHPQLGIFNGFGTKGVLMIPALAQNFMDFLLHQKPLPKKVNLQRF